MNYLHSCWSLSFGLHWCNKICYWQILGECFWLEALHIYPLKYVGLNIILWWHNCKPVPLSPVVIGHQDTVQKISKLFETEKCWLLKPDWSSHLDSYSYLIWYSFDICELSISSNKASVNLLKSNKLITCMANNNIRLLFFKLLSIELCSLECYSDVSFVHLLNECSQGDFIF